MLSQQSVHCRPADRQRLGGVDGPHALGLQLAHARCLYLRRPPLVNAGGLRFGDALQLPLPPQVGLQLGEYSQPAEEALARSGAGVDRLLSFRTAPSACTVRTNVVDVWRRFDKNGLYVFHANRRTVVVNARSRRDYAQLWSWEICRDGEPLPIRLRDDA